MTQWKRTCAADMRAAGRDAIREPCGKGPGQPSERARPAVRARVRFVIDGVEPLEGDAPCENDAHLRVHVSHPFARNWMETACF
jgi:hypothetical protein